MDANWLKTQFRLNPGKTRAGLAKALGLEAPAVSKILNGTRQIKAQEYIAMRRFFGLPADGEKASGAARNADSGAYTLAPLESGLEDAGSPAAGAESWTIPAHIFRQRTKAPPEQIRIFTAQESVMAPDVLLGDPVLVDLSDRTPSPPGIFIVSDGLGHIIRRCDYVPHSDPPQIRLSTSSGKAEPLTLPLGKAGILGRVIAKLQWL